MAIDRYQSSESGWDCLAEGRAASAKVPGTQELSLVADLCRPAGLDGARMAMLPVIIFSFQNDFPRLPRAGALTSAGRTLARPASLHKSGLPHPYFR